MVAAYDYYIGMLRMPKGFDLRCGAGKTARVWVEGKGGALKPGQAMVLLPLREGEDENSIVGYLAPLRQTLIDNNDRHVNVVGVRERLPRAQARYRKFATATAVSRLVNQGLWPRSATHSCCWAERWGARVSTGDVEIRLLVRPLSS
jgi:hypothetical protein